MGIGIVPKVIKSIATTCATHSRQILLAVSVTGAAGSVVLAIKATPRAMEVVEDLREVYGDHIPAKELIRKVGPIYAPTAIMLLTTCGCIIGAHRLADKENAILASIAAGAQGTVAEYEKRLADQLGEKAANKLKAEVEAARQDTSMEYPEVINNPPNIAGGFQLYREPESGQFFWATEHSLNEAVAQLNRQIDNEMWATLNDFLYLLDIDRCDFGDRVAWDIDHKLHIPFTTAEKCKREPYAGRSYLLLCYEDRPVVHR